MADQTLDPLDLSGAAEVAAVTVRRRIIELADRLATEQEPAAVRDIGIGLATLADAAKNLDELANRESLHKAFLANVRDNSRALLEIVTGRAWDGDLEYIDRFDELLVRAKPRGDDERLPDGFRSLDTRPLYAVRDFVRTLNDRLYGYEGS